MSFFFIILILLLGGLAGLVIYFTRFHRAGLQDLQRIYAAINTAPSFAAVVEILSREMIGRGVVSSEAFYVRDTKNFVLRHGDHTISALHHGNMARSFFGLRSQKVTQIVETDRPLIDKFGKDSVLIPLYMSPQEACWKINNCKNDRCSCYSQDTPFCWQKSGKNWRGKELPNYSEKTRRCLRCHAFLPVGVFVTKTKGLRNARRGQRFLNSFNTVIRKIMEYENAAMQSITCGLTQIYNRRGLDAKLKDSFAIAKRGSLPISFLMLDIDHFKKFNDTYGHQAGDDILREVAAVMRQTIRESDTIGRYGGEEFTVILSLTDKATATDVAEKLRQAVDDHAFKNSRRVSITIGVAGNPDDDAYTFEDLLKKSDAALYAGKQLKRNSVYVYSGQLAVPSKSTAVKKGDRSQRSPVVIPQLNREAAHNPHDQGPF